MLQLSIALMVQSLDVGTATDERSTLEKEGIDTSEFDDDEFEDVELEKAAATGVGLDEEVAEEQKKRWIQTPSVSRKGKRAVAVCMLTIVVALVAGLLIGFKLRDSGSSNHLELFLGEICSTTLYPETCNSTLYGADTTSTNSYVAKSMGVSVTATNETLLNLTRCRDAWPIKTGMQYSTLQMCVDMYEDIMDASGKFLETVNSNAQPSVAVVNDLEQRASAALTYHFTCLNGLQEQGLLNGSCGIDTERTTELLSNALSLVNMFPAATDTAIPAPSRRRLLTDTPESRTISYTVMEDGFPAWLSMGDRRLLQSSNDSIGANVVVALDGSGDYSSIQTAIDRAPSNSDQRYVIHIKAGVYEELVKVPGNKLRLTFVGDGAGVTIISGNLSSSVNNVTTVFTATVTVTGDYFMAKNLTIRNTAGPYGRQAVALRVTSQQSAFTWLNIEGYEGTLYAHASQQFYKSCTILGTVNYIFGSAAAVFQNSSLLARLPSPDQTITYTRSDISSALVQKYAGLVFQFCLVDTTSELKQNGTGTSVFLGRPGEAYARTVFIKSQLGTLLDPAGWISWNKSASNSSSNVEFAEYLNFGQGSSLSLRVVNSKQLTPWHALDYGVDKFLKGKFWLPVMNISYSGSI